MSSVSETKAGKHPIISRMLVLTQEIEDLEAAL